MTALEGAVVYEEFGRSLAPSPHFVSSILSGGVLARAATTRATSTSSSSTPRPTESA
jgi:hypothetical protein